MSFNFLRIQQLECSDKKVCSAVYVILLLGVVVKILLGGHIVC